MIIKYKLWPFRWIIFAVLFLNALLVCPLSIVTFICESGVAERGLFELPVVVVCTLTVFYCSDKSLDVLRQYVDI